MFRGSQGNLIRDGHRPVLFGAPGFGDTPSPPTTTATATPTSPYSASPPPVVLLGSAAELPGPILFGTTGLLDTPAGVSPLLLLGATV